MSIDTARIRRGPAAISKLHLETATVMFADIAEYVRLVEQDERGVIERSRRLLSRDATAVVRKHRGRVIRLIGDGLLLKFADARSAARCASDLHVLAAKESDAFPERERIWLCIGIHCAEIL